VTGGGERGQTGRRGARGERGPGPSNARMLVIFVFVVFAFALLAVRSEVQQRRLEATQRQADRNTQQIARTQYDLCLGDRADALRQNALIDNAIAAERRKPAPDAKRIRDLTDFRNTVPDCGQAPAGR
jgi:hypothetical protein